MEAIPAQRGTMGKAAGIDEPVRAKPHYKHYHALQTLPFTMSFAHPRRELLSDFRMPLAENN